LPPIIVNVNVKSILLVFGLLSMLIALLLSFQRINCNLVLEGDQKFLLTGGKPVYLKCTRMSAPRNVQPFKTYPNAFENTNVAKLELGPKMFIPLFKLSAHVMQLKDGTALSGPDILKDGRNKYSAVLGDSKLDFTIEKKDLIKKNSGKLIMFSIFLFAGALLLILSLAV